MTLDPALEWLLEDAKRQGLTLSEYERRYGIIIEGRRLPSPAELRIRRHEIPAGLMTDGEVEIAKTQAKRRTEARRRRAAPDTRAA